MQQDIAVLQLLQAKGLGPKTLSRLLKFLAAQGRSVEEFVNLTTSQLSDSYRLKLDMINTIKANRLACEKLAQELANQAVMILVKGDPQYPSRLAQVLGDTAPPVLFVKGNSAILSQQAVGFCGSRKASDKGLGVAAECARLLSHENVNVVSGYANGVDFAAHQAAVACGGVTTFVLAEGILHFKKKKGIAEFLTDTNHVVVSEFLPSLTWSVHNAMQRNRTICGLSNALIIIETGLSGGTFAAGESSLELQRPLFVVDYAQPAVSAEGNDYFIQKGAKALRRSRENNTPNLKEIFQTLQENVPPKTLFDWETTSVA